MTFVLFTERDKTFITVTASGQVKE